MTKLEALEESRKHNEAAYRVLSDAGFDKAHVYESVQGLVAEMWMHMCGWVTGTITQFLQ